VSRGLGPTQRRALEVLAIPQTGLTTEELSAKLGVTQRRCRTVVASLAARGEVAADAATVTGTGGRRRVWLTDQRSAFIEAEREAKKFHRWFEGALYRIDHPRPQGHHCPNCGWWIQDHAY
jgi:hypothetical protein